MPNNGFCEIVNFQSCGEIESMHEFEFYIAFASKLGGATGLNRIVKGC